MGCRGSVVVRERDLQGNVRSSVVIFFFSTNTSNNSEVFQYQFEDFLSLLKLAATVCERES